MHPRWIIEPHEDGPVVTASLANGNVILQRSRWVHDCLEVDATNKTVIYREQGDIEDDDPATWPATRLPLRCVDGHWQTEVDEPKWRSWIRDHELSVEQSREFDRRSPGISLTDRVGEAQHRLELLRATGHGWVRFAPDVSAVLAHELQSRK